MSFANSMVTDRTEEDVSIAETLRLKIQSGIALTEEEKIKFERGACTITMLNRIENAKLELKNLLNPKGYYIDTDYNQYSYSDIFYYNNYKTFIEDIKRIRNNFYMPYSPKAPDYLYGYVEANNIEKIFVDIETYVSKMVEKYRYCGDYICGSD